MTKIDDIKSRLQRREYQVRYLLTVGTTFFLLNLPDSVFAQKSLQDECFNTVTDGIHLSLNAKDMSPGSVFLLKARAPKSIEAQNANVQLGDFIFPCIPPKVEDEQTQIQCLIPVPLRFKEGTTKIKLMIGSLDSKVTQKVITFDKTIVPDSFDKKLESISLHEKIVRPDDFKTIERLAREEEEISQKLTTSSEDINLSNMNFGMPFRPKRISSTFAVTRIFNGNPQRRTHWGIDLAAPVSTPIYPIASGRVVTAKNYHFTGKTVIVDHGGGLVSMYAHLSRYHIKPGDIVNRKTIIGRVGTTGKVTGPAVHLQTVVHSFKVDPLSVLALLNDTCSTGTPLVADRTKNANYSSEDK